MFFHLFKVLISFNFKSNQLQTFCFEETMFHLWTNRLPGRVVSRQMRIGEISPRRQRRRRRRLPRHDRRPRRGRKTWKGPRRFRRQLRRGRVVNGQHDHRLHRVGLGRGGRGERGRRKTGRRELEYRWRQRRVVVVRVPVFADSRKRVGVIFSG